MQLEVAVVAGRVKVTDTYGEGEETRLKTMLDEDSTGERLVVGMLGTATGVEDATGKRLLKLLGMTKGVEDDSTAAGELLG